MHNRVTVTIDGFEYTVVSEDSVEYIKKNAALVDKAIREVKETASLSSLTATVLTAMNFSDRWLKAQETADSLRSQVKDYAADCNRLRSEIARLKKGRENRPGGPNGPYNGQNNQNSQNNRDNRETRERTDAKEAVKKD